MEVITPKEKVEPVRKFATVKDREPESQASPGHFELIFVVGSTEVPTECVPEDVLGVLAAEALKSWPYKEYHVSDCHIYTHRGSEQVNLDAAKTVDESCLKHKDVVFIAFPAGYGG